MKALPLAAAAAAAARSRAFARILRDVEPPPPDWGAERLARAAIGPLVGIPPDPEPPEEPEPEPAAHAGKRPGVGVAHFPGHTEVTALGDKQPLWHTFIARDWSAQVNIVLRELIRAYRICGVDFAEHYGAHDHVETGDDVRRPKDMVAYSRERRMLRLQGRLGWHAI